MEKELIIKNGDKWEGRYKEGGQKALDYIKSRQKKFGEPELKVGQKISVYGFTPPMLPKLKIIEKDEKRIVVVPDHDLR